MPQKSTGTERLDQSNSKNTGNPIVEHLLFELKKVIAGLEHFMTF